MNELLRELAPISEAAWAEIDDQARKTLKLTLAARKLVDFSGPHGWSHSAVDIGRTEETTGPGDGIEARLRRVQPLVELRVPFELVAWVAESGRLPVPNFSAGGVATPADAALMMQLGAEAVFVGSGIFKSGNPQQRARAIVRAVTHFRDPKVLVEVSKGLGEPMVGIDINTMQPQDRLASRGI